MTHLQRMGVEQVEQVGWLLRSSFEEHLHPYLPYCSPRIGRHLAVDVMWPASVPGRRQVVALNDEGRVEGFAEWHRGPGTTLLAYVCVSHEARGRGVAAELLRDELQRQDDRTTVVLDVFVHNELARSWYGRLGMRHESGATWWSRAMPAPAAASSDLQLLEWPSALAALDRYGFCRAQVRWSGREVALGLTSAHVLRVGEAETFTDDDLLAYLAAQLVDCRRVLLIDAGSAPPCEGAEVVLRSVRLSAASGTIRKALT